MILPHFQPWKAGQNQLIGRLPNLSLHKKILGVGKILSL
nr:MAG TPA: hypothetical protein [Caudoviricetes sp.]